MEVPLSQTNLFSFVYTPRWQHLSQFAPRGLPGPGVPHLVPPGAIAVRTLGPGGGPIFELRIDDVYHVISELICIVTDVNMTNDRQEYPPHRLRWISRGGIVVSNYSNATQAGRLVNNQVRDTCGKLAFHMVSSPLGFLDKTSWAATRIMLKKPLLTAIGGNSNYDVAFMLNLPTYNSAGADPRRNLRRVIQRVLHNLYRLLEFPNNNVAWRRRKASIAFPLLGYGPLGYDLGHLADDTLSAITLWFNHPVYGAARKGRIGRIYRLIPAHNHPKLRAIDTKIAWKIAWE
jgi:hypothetical protein